MEDAQVVAYNNFNGLFGYKPTVVLEWLRHTPCKTTFLLCGNRFGKGETVVVDWITRLWCKHPQRWKNIYPSDELRTLRICCATLPTDKDGEVKNTIYPILKRRMPYNWVDWRKDDITVRNPVIKVRNPLLGAGHKPVNLEFVSYGQETMRQAGVARRALIQDEESGQDFFEEQQARTMDTGGDMMVAFTPIPGQIGWMFDALYERASVVYRTPLVRARFKERYGEDYPEVQHIKGKDDICVIMAATDDNPYFDDLARDIGAREGRSLTKAQYLDEFFADRYGSDEDLIDARRYGIFKQLSGKIHKAFSSTHVISGSKYFPVGIPDSWYHLRAIDYHQKNPWAVVWLARSDDNEIFVYRNASFLPGRMQTYDIVSAIVDMSGDYKFRKNLIDPLAGTTQSNTGYSTVQDLNRLFREFANDGRGTGGSWITWDTKGTIGREEMTKRLLNARKAGVPFNNKVCENGRTTKLPTIWFLDDCRMVIEAMSKWRYEDWGSKEAEMRNDEKEKPQNKWSHFPIAIECALKDTSVSRPMYWDNYTSGGRDEHGFGNKHSYFHGRRAS
jgi:hypothetical protein